ncbi:LysR family transcriptional regulator [Mizugakiibacter sediminis]|uniref:LysR family transcriptional regulator n=1 Tax=Mizugakiibacter sediminis TaxID=1475481 RepID=A0A0K8QT55_9GAMM|nr:LysR family transcriptional regulator [Mizugakiibacter sediminis]GAP67547.1 LysR family transcriptional regulator [Mizugakiibacter sediminis]
MAIDDPLDGIAAFVQAAESGSFAQAAARLRVTRSAVSKSIAAMERRLGARLFQRTTRRQSLTESGQVYYERCRRALDELEAGAAALASGRSEPRGRLRVSVPVLFGRHCVAPVLARLAQRHPALALEIAFSDRVVDLIEEGFDLAVRIGTLPDSASLAARRLATQDFVLCAAPAFLAAAGWNGRLDGMAGLAGIAYARAGRETPWQWSDGDGRVHALGIVTRLRYDDVQAIADAAVAGFGIARLPRWLAAPQAQAGRLKLLTDREHVLRTDIHAVWPHAHHLPAKTRAAIDALAAEIPAALDRSQQP